MDRIVTPSAIPSDATRAARETPADTLLDSVDVRLLRESSLSLRRDASPGVDGMTWEELQPLRRMMIPKRERKAAPASNRCAGRQDRPEGDAGRAELCL